MEELIALLVGSLVAAMPKGWWRWALAGVVLGVALFGAIVGLAVSRGWL